MQKMIKPMIPMAIFLTASSATAQFLTPEEQRSLTPYERESLRIQEQLQQDSSHREIREGLDRLDRDNKNYNARILKALRHDDYNSHDSYGYESQNEYRGFDD